VEKITAGVASEAELGKNDHAAAFASEPASLFGHDDGIFAGMTEYQLRRHGGDTHKAVRFTDFGGGRLASGHKVEKLAQLLFAASKRPRAATLV
jgi:hypothetical protein